LALAFKISFVIRRAILALVSLIMRAGGAYLRHDLHLSDATSLQVGVLRGRLIASKGMLDLVSHRRPFTLYPAAPSASASNNPIAMQDCRMLSPPFTVAIARNIKRGEQHRSSCRRAAGFQLGQDASAFLKASRGKMHPPSALTLTMEVTPCMARADANNTTRIFLDSLDKKSPGSCSNWFERGGKVTVK
jgi:hypothetical protein